MILERLTKQHNWISEFDRLTLSIPNQWKRILQSEDSINTRINIGIDFTLKYKTSTMSISKPLNNKTILNYVLKKTQIKPIMEKMWESKFNLANTVGLWSSVYQSIHFALKRNDLRQFRFKLINAIMPCKKNYSNGESQRTSYANTVK